MTDNIETVKRLRTEGRTYEADAMLFRISHPPMQEGGWSYVRLGGNWDMSGCASPSRDGERADPCGRKDGGKTLVKHETQEASSMGVRLDAPEAKEQGHDGRLPGVQEGGKGV